jgi:hypothetical protein
MNEAQSLMEGIEALDLEMIKLKLMDLEEGKGWSRDYADQVGEEYRKFLALTRTYPELAIVPSGPVDAFWHNHILDTQKYGPDCEMVFGFFLHHFPYFGMRGDEDMANLNASWENTIQAYRRHFGNPPPGFWEVGMRCPKCGKQAAFALPRELAIRSR